MKKTLFRLGLCTIATLLLTVIFYSCKKDASTTNVATATEGTLAPINLAANSIVPCGTPSVQTLWAGQTTNAGTVTISNDANFVYVTFNVTATGIKISETHVYVGDCAAVPVNNNGIPVAGQFPHKWSAASSTDYSTSYTAKIPIADVVKDAGGCFCVYAHAALVKLNADGSYSEWNTGWGGDKPFTGPRWGFFTNYCIQECPPPTTVCYGNETAWVAGTRFVAKGNWATWTPYVAGSTVNIYAGQTNLAGTATFSAITDGKVTITISLTNGWMLQDVSESVKIQGYTSTPPASNPSPGGFKTYKGTSLTVTVDAFNYYGIHLDVRRVINCPPTTTP